MKRFVIIILLCAVAISFSGLTIAANETKSVSSSSSDDIKWIAKCMDDNKDQGKPAEVVSKYCECMVEKMDDNETQTVTQWEKTHPQEQKECDEKAGWK